MNKVIELNGSYLINVNTIGCIELSLEVNGNPCDNTLTIKTANQDPFVIKRETPKQIQKYYRKIKNFLKNDSDVILSIMM